MPEGWKSTRLSAKERAAAIAREPDPRAGAFLRQRLPLLAGQKAVAYLYDFRAIASGELSTVEVYRYSSGDPTSVAKTLLPRLRAAGLSPRQDAAQLPAGKAVTLQGSLRRGSVTARNKIYLVKLGGRVVGLSTTDTQTPDPQIGKVVDSLRAG